MNSDSFQPADILRICSVPQHARLFVLPTVERPSRILSQQRRALNLVHALFDSEAIGKQGLGVIGAGFGGLTAAAYAAQQGVRVHVFEKEARILDRFRKSQRFIHPRMYDWPAKGWKNANAALPVMNWWAGEARSVVAQLTQKFETVRNILGVKLETNCSDVVIERASQRSQSIVVGWTDIRGKYFHRSFDVVVLAVGFGRERTPPTYNPAWCQPYWDLEIPSHRENPIDRKQLFVLGNGDGALADLVGLAAWAHDPSNEQAFRGDFVNLLDELKHVREEVEDLERKFSARDLTGRGASEEEYSKELRSLVKGKVPQLRSCLKTLWISGRSAHHLDLQGTYAGNRALFLAAYPQCIVKYNASSDVPRITGRKFGPFVATSENDKWVLVRNGPEDPLKRGFPEIAEATANAAWRNRLTLSERPTSRAAWSARVRWEAPADTGIQLVKPVPRLRLSTEWADSYVQRIIFKENAEGATLMLRTLLQVYSILFDEISFTDASILDGTLMTKVLQLVPETHSQCCVFARGHTLLESAHDFLLTKDKNGKWCSKGTELSRLGGRRIPARHTPIAGNDVYERVNFLRKHRHLRRFFVNADRAHDMLRSKIRLIEKGPKLVAIEPQSGLLEALPELERAMVTVFKPRTNEVARSRTEVFDRFRQLGRVPNNVDVLTATSPKWLPPLASWYNAAYNATIAHRNGATACDILWVNPFMGGIDITGPIKSVSFDARKVNALTQAQTNESATEIAATAAAWRRGHASLLEVLRQIPGSRTVKLPSALFRQSVRPVKDRLHAFLSGSRREFTMAELLNDNPEPFAPQRAILLLANNCLLSAILIGQ